ncbi:MMPL family transporter [Dactylosporangium darangshiense]|uniref:MMPL family transporter n=2 Tax=Dactylosporangium darangshiense TaxID=579108 RepID=A0ABP8DCV2_9ACTN
MAALGPLAGQLSAEQRNDAAAYAPRDAESTRVRAELARGGDTLPAVVVYVRASGITAADRSAVQGRFAGSTVEESADGRALLQTVPLDARDLDALYDRTVQLRAEARSGLPPGLAAQVTGPAGALVDGAGAFLDVDVTVLLVTLAVVASLLLVIYRSPVLWLAPLLSVMVAAGAAQGAVTLVVRAFDLTVNGLSQGILTVLVFGVGTDYALLLTARYREELHRHADRRAAMATALRRAAPAITASAATVVGGLLCLLPASVTTTRSLGAIGAAGVAVVLTAMLSLYPALLVALGRWVFWPRVPLPGTPTPAAPAWRWLAGRLARRPRLAWIAAATVLVALAVPLLGARIGVPSERSYVTAPESVVGDRVVAMHFPAGSSAPADIVAPRAIVDALMSTLPHEPGIAGVRRVGDTHLQAVLASGPGSPAAADTVRRLRAVLPADALVGGAAATVLDTAEANDHDRWIVIPAVLAVLFVVLVLLLRALLAPVLLVAIALASFAAALGGGWLLFGPVLGFAGLDDQAILIGFVVLTALGIDYNIFLLSRVREDGVLPALVATGGVITSAGVVLAATFAALTVVPVVFVIELGVVVAAGVLLDTLLVRSVLVPSLLLELPGGGVPIGRVPDGHLGVDDPRDQPLGANRSRPPHAD